MLTWRSGLPVDLQYLPEDKKREEDPDIRKMLLETLLLVRTREGSRTDASSDVRLVLSLRLCLV